MEPAKRIMPPPEGVTLTIRITDGDDSPVHRAVSRRYDDGHGLVEVTRRTPDPQFEKFAQTFTYDGAPIADVVAKYHGSYYTNETTETVGCARTLADMGLQKADLFPREPDEPCSSFIRNADRSTWNSSWAPLPRNEHFRKA